MSRVGWGLLAAICVKLRWLIVVGWVAAAAILTVTLPNLHEAQTGALGDLVPKDAEAIDAEIRSYELFNFPLLSRTVLVQRDEEGLTRLDQQRLAGLTVGINGHRFPELRGIRGALAVTNAVEAPPLSKERATTALTYLFFDPKVEPGDQTELVDRLIEQRFGPDSVVGVTGPVPARAAQADVIEERLRWVELATILLVALAVGLHFRSLLAPLLTLVVVAVSYLVSIRLLAWTGMQLDISIPSEVGPVIVVLLFGIVTDYSIFFISRYRAKLRDGVRPQRAAEEATSQLLPIIVTAGLTIVLASVTLLVARVGFLQAFGPGIALAVLVGLVVTITLVPALLAISGERLFWPSRPRPERDEPPKERPPRFRWVRAATRQPVVVTIVCLAFLVLAASGLARMDVGNPIIRGLPPGNEVRATYEAAESGFTPGVLSPTVAMVEQAGIPQDKNALVRLQDLEPGITTKTDALTRLQDRIEKQPGVAAVAGPGNAPFRLAPGATLAENGKAARYVIVLDGDPLGGPALETYRKLRDRMPAMMEAAGLPEAKASFAGDTALAEETVGRTFDDLWRVAPLALLVVFVTLAIFLRALVAPLYLVLASVLALFAALGLTAFVFQELLGRTEITYYVPFAAAVLLLSLGSDYNVFVTGRIWEEARKRPLREAVVVGGGKAAAPIAVAGLILAGSFALLLLVPVSGFQELAVAMSLGLLLDAFLVRTLLVPAMITLVGKASDWPGRGLRMRRRRRVSIGARRA